LNVLLFWFTIVPGKAMYVIFLKASVALYTARKATGEIHKSLHDGMGALSAVVGKVTFFKVTAMKR
jgi:hypothetical protein